MRSALANVVQHRPGRSRSASLSTVPPAETSSDYLPQLASIAATILYKSPLPSPAGLPVYILNAAAFPDAYEVDYDSLLPYVLARLPGEDELLSGTEYEIILFAGGQPEGATVAKKQGPGVGWYIQAYHVLSRATRKKLQKLYIVHPRGWVKVLIGVFGTIVSPKFRRKVVTVNTISQLALQLPIEKLLIPQAAYLHDRKFSQDIYAPYATGRRAFGALHPLPKNMVTGETRLPRVLREATTFLLMPVNVKTEGLFRIPPHSMLAGILKEAYDRGQKYIIWRERDATVVDPGLNEALLDEVRPEDCYSVHLAASLIKYWYRDLREPVFPEASYENLRERYSDPASKITPEDLVEMLLPQSEISPVSVANREILMRHLLPMLSEVAAHETENKMSPENLAICFAMTMVCGSNQLEDAKMTNIIRRILHAAIESWPILREATGLSIESFEADLQSPAEAIDYEDPLETGRQFADNGKSEVEIDDEGHRIVLSDFDDPPTPSGIASNPVSASSRTSAPPLPKRPSSSLGIPWASAQTNGVIPGPHSPYQTSNSTTMKPPPLPPRIPSNSTNDYPTDPASLVSMAETLRQKPAPIAPILPALDTNPNLSTEKIINPTSTTSTTTTNLTHTASKASATSTTSNPPRYSSVFDSDGRSILHSTNGNGTNALADSPKSFTSVADGFGFAPELREELGRIGNEDDPPPPSQAALQAQQPEKSTNGFAYEKSSNFPSEAATEAPASAAAIPPEYLSVPKRKAVSGGAPELKTWTEESHSTGKHGDEIPAVDLGASGLSRMGSEISGPGGEVGGGLTASGFGGASSVAEAGEGYWAKVAAQRALSGRKPTPASAAAATSTSTMVSGPTADSGNTNPPTGETETGELAPTGFDEPQTTSEPAGVGRGEAGPSAKPAAALAGDEG
ncbi:hypothetical protein MBLNU230_g1498t1 [Neophaeotheca triangularis]